MSDDAALFEKGQPIRRAVLGAEHIGSSMACADDFMMSFQLAATAIDWDWTWGEPFQISRSSLPFHQRSLARGLAGHGDAGEAQSFRRHATSGTHGFGQHSLGWR
ncbi:MAG: hypothetical protein IOD03_16600 [Methylocystis sp.]|jgi:hypothetical protein|nr:hypothetical protein [Roseomonas sp.]MCA3291513.1 hypothetical protein [Roseomonas sp.]MCA3296177.1 hypothetical protein [Roseomonas sp.]MCA3342803.1 hypothetical protein [Roseomonas sp.]MCA3585298.1 hypothetical protein [Methylocystis sp.]